MLFIDLYAFLVNHSSGCWVDIVCQLKLNPEEFLKERFSDIITQNINMSELKQVCIDGIVRKKKEII